MPRPGSISPRDRHGLRPRPARDRSATIRRVAALLAAALPLVVLLGGCGQDEQAREVAAHNARTDTRPATPMNGLAAADDLGPPQLLAFACGEAAPYLAVHDPAHDTVTLYTMDGVHVLTPQPAASGAKYAGERHLLWTKGQTSVRLEIDGEPLEGCEPSGRQRVLTAAYQGGFALRASGNEPFWTLLAGPQSIRLDGLNRPSASFAGLSESELGADGLAHGGVVEREAGPHRLRVTVTREHCLDTMSGEPSPLSVSVELDGETLRGCGVWLQP
jgi:uncharacterized membrane protein/membrane-bound inhibitor of C-type lysozyme